MTTTTDTFEQAYAHIRAELARVEALFAEELRSDRPEVAVLCEHMVRFRGKMLRPALLLLAARATGPVRPVHLGLAAVIEMFHLATLVHDDVLDDAKLRRQVATINHGWGNEVAVMLGDWLMSHAYHLCSKQDIQWASLQIATVAHRVCEGELMQLFRRGRLGVAADEYVEIISRKTASLTGLAAQLGAHFNGAPAAVERACLAYGTDLGIAFQIADDILDLAGDEREAGKTLGSDFAKGKVTLPLIHFLAKASPAEVGRVEQLWHTHSGNGRQMEQANPAELGELRRVLAETGCIESAEQVARDYVRSSKAHLAGVADCDVKADMEMLADFVLARSR